MGFILMYDVTNEESFKAVGEWADQVRANSLQETQVVLVGNKCDLEDHRVITFEQGKRLADDLGFAFFESSAKDNINVRSAFDCLVDLISVKMEGVANGGMRSGVTDLSEKPAQNNSCAC